MDFITETLSPEVIAAIEQTYGSVQLWLSATVDWTSAQMETFYATVTEDTWL